MSQRQTFVLVIARANLDSNLIPSLKVIIPSIALTAPVRVYTSMKYQLIGNNKYALIKNHLQNQNGNCDLSETLKKVLSQNKANFRVCILGNQNVNWEVIMSYKRNGIIIDTAGNHPKYPQISFTTKGIHKKVNEYDMTKNFLNIFAISSSMRHLFKIQIQHEIESYLECKCCQPANFLKNDIWVCSVCLAVYCPQNQTKINSCKVCNFTFNQ